MIINVFQIMKVENIYSLKTSNKQDGATTNAKKELISR